MTSRGPAKSKAERQKAKAETERTSKLRATLGLRYLPKGANPTDDDFKFEVFPGLSTAVFDVAEDKVRRFLITKGHLSKQEADCDDLEGKHSRVNAAILSFIRTQNRFGNTLLRMSSARGIVGDETTARFQQSIPAPQRRHPRR